LRIGATESISPNKAGQKKDAAALETLQGFIQEETGFKNEILPLKDWRELGKKMANGDVHLGVFEGYEFAWAQQQLPKLKPLAVAVNVYVFPSAYVVTKKDNPAKVFAGLQGQSFVFPETNEGFLRLFVAKQCQDNGKPISSFFSKVKTSENVEDALDDVVDGSVGAVVADRAALEAFKRTKPGRFKQLKEIAHSQQFPPGLVAYYDSTLDPATLKRFETGLLQARDKEKGQTMLTLFKLTGFEKVPADFGKMIALTQKTYDPSLADSK
jgi:ABC-type phosphate/phosphonate transport system substrate-binding protein